MEIKPPISADERPSTNRLLLLTQSKVYLRLASSLALSRLFQVESVAVALILSVDVDQHSQTLGNVPFGCQMDREGLRLLWDRNEGLDKAVAVDSAIFFELETSFGPFDLASYLSEARHLGRFGDLRRRRSELFDVGGSEQTSIKERLRDSRR